MKRIESISGSREERYERLREAAQWCAVEGDEATRALLDRELEELWSALHAMSDES